MLITFFSPATYKVRYHVSVDLSWRSLGTNSGAVSVYVEDRDGKKVIDAPPARANSSHKYYHTFVARAVTVTTTKKFEEALILTYVPKLVVPELGKARVRAHTSIALESVKKV